MTTSVAGTAGRTGGDPGRSGRAAGAESATRTRRRAFGAQPLGILFSAPYLIFIGVVFAYPIIFAVWMSFHDYFFTAPARRSTGRSSGSTTTSPR